MTYTLPQRPQDQYTDFDVSTSAWSIYFAFPLHLRVFIVTVCWQEEKHSITCRNNNPGGASAAQADWAVNCFSTILKNVLCQWKIIWRSPTETNYTFRRIITADQQIDKYRHNIGPLGGCWWKMQEQDVQNVLFVSGCGDIRTVFSNIQFNLFEIIHTCVNKQHSLRELCKWLVRHHRRRQRKGQRLRVIVGTPCS